MIAPVSRKELRPLLIALTDQQPRVRLEAGNFDHLGCDAAATVVVYSLDAVTSPPVQRGGMQDTQWTGIELRPPFAFRIVGVPI